MQARTNASRLLRRSAIGPVSAAAMAVGWGSLPADAQADEGSFDWALSYQADFLASRGDGLHTRGRELDSLHATADVDLEKAAGIRGGAFHVDLNNTSGAAPNDDAGTLQGVDNIEVGQPRLRVYELWYEQSAYDGRLAVRFGLQEINADFYATDASGLLLNPSFGFGPEFSGTGVNGPSTYPSTALAVRGRWLVNENLDLRLGVFNGMAGTPGDPGGVDTSFDEGVLTIAEATWHGWGSISLGGWRYSRRQDDVRAVDGFGDPLRRRAYGLYALGQKRLWGDDDDVRRTTAFAHVGVSDGKTSPLRASWRAGVMVEQVFESRPDSAFSFGVTRASLARGERANMIDDGVDASGGETTFELTYSDRLTSAITLQPDIQYASHAGGDRERNSLTFGLRLSIDLSGS